MAGEYMYNRYIPQPDGTYQKKKIAEMQRRQPHNTQHNPPIQREECPPPVPPPEPCSPVRPQKKPQCHKQEGIFSFFSQLLPRELDTSDLMIIILLLLIAGDCEENRSNALLTLALYFFL